MDISIIIPCYNLESYIARCLKSIASQRYDRSAYEIIVVFDSCTDDSETAAAAALDGNVNRKFIRAERRRPGLARNIGLDAADGEYVWFIDGDDFLTCDTAFARLTRIIRTAKATAVFMPAFESDEPIRDDFAVWRYFYDRKFIGDDRFNGAYIDEDWDFTRRLTHKPHYAETRFEEPLYHYTYPRGGSIVTEYMKFRARCGNGQN